jgi:hypothetical protein
MLTKYVIIVIFTNMIYKYRKFGENTDKMVRNNTLYFSNPLNYNDPFDTIINFYFEGSY